MQLCKGNAQRFIALYQRLLHRGYGSAQGRGSTARPALPRLRRGQPLGNDEVCKRVIATQETKKADWQKKAISKKHNIEQHYGC